MDEGGGGTGGEALRKRSRTEGKSAWEIRERRSEMGEVEMCESTAEVTERSLELISSSDVGGNATIAATWSGRRASGAGIAT